MIVIIPHPIHTTAQGRFHRPPSRYCKTPRWAQLSARRRLPLLTPPLQRGLTYALIAPTVWEKVQTLSQKGLKIEVLDSLAVSLAAARGKYFTAVATQGLLALGAYLEQRAARHADDLLRHLLKPMPTQAWVERDGALVQIPCSALQVGDHIEVGPGEMIPIDGKVIGGNAAVNQASVTGENLAVRKEAGDKVLSGTVLEGGRLRIRATRVGAETTTARIARFIENALQQQSQTQSLAEQLADQRVYLTLGVTNEYCYSCRFGGCRVGVCWRISGTRLVLRSRALKCAYGRFCYVRRSTRVCWGCHWICCGRGFGQGSFPGQDPGARRETRSSHRCSRRRGCPFSECVLQPRIGWPSIQHLRASVVVSRCCRRTFCRCWRRPRPLDGQTAFRLAWRLDAFKPCSLSGCRRSPCLRPCTARIGRTVTPTLHRADALRHASHACGRRSRRTLGTGALVYAVTLDLDRLASVFLVDYACALKLGTPVAIKSAMYQGAKHGILFRGSSALDSLAQADTFVFDKTGTLTSGLLEVTDVLSLDADWEAAHLLALVAVVKQARQQHLGHIEHEDVDFLVAHGITTHAEGRRVVIGSRHFLETHKHISFAAHENYITALEQSGKMLLYVALEQHPLGLIGLRDSLRPEAKTVLAQLRQSGARRLVLLTGDRQDKAEALARELEMDEVYAECPPEGKAAVVEQLRAHGAKVAFIGDGVNDAPALIAADVGIAMPRGADLARATADIVLLDEHLQTLLAARTLSVGTLRLIRNHFRISTGVNTAVIAGAAFGLLSPVWSALLHNGMTLGVLLNSMAGVSLKTSRLEAFQDKLETLRAAYQSGH